MKTVFLLASVLAGLAAFRHPSASPAATTAHQYRTQSEIIGIGAPVSSAGHPDTLIPLFGGELFVTYGMLDTAVFRRYKPRIPGAKDFISPPLPKGDMSGYKWGVVNRQGKVVLPFIFDGIKALSDTRGVVSIYQGSYSLNTGVPRYSYAGTSFLFTKAGLIDSTKAGFHLTIVMLGDWYDPSSVIEQGPEFFLPEEYRTITPIVRRRLNSH